MGSCKFMFSLETYFLLQKYFTTYYIILYVVFYVLRYCESIIATHKLIKVKQKKTRKFKSLLCQVRNNM